MKQTRQHEEVTISVPMLSPEAAYALSNWLYELAHEIDRYYGDEIRSHRQWLDNEKVEELT